MWRDLISGLTPDWQFSPPASRADLDALAAALNVTLSPDLTALLAETDGVNDAYGYAIIWSCQRILAENSKFRTSPVFLQNYAPLDDILFFGSPGVDSIAFGFPISPPGSAAILAWYPMEDRREQIAVSLRQFITTWLDGSLTI